MDAVLTGQAGTDALRVYSRFGALDARFDGRKVAAAIRTARGRTKLLVSSVPSRILRATVVRLVARPRARRSRRRSQARTTRSAARRGPTHPARPAAHDNPSALLSVAQGGSGGYSGGRA